MMQGMMMGGEMMGQGKMGGDAKGGQIGWHESYVKGVQQGVACAVSTSGSQKTMAAAQHEVFLEATMEVTIIATKTCMHQEPGKRTRTLTDSVSNLFRGRLR